MSTKSAGLEGQSVLIIGRPSGIAAATVGAVRGAGARVVAAGRDKAALEAADSGDSDITGSLRG